MSSVRIGRLSPKKDKSYWVSLVEENLGYSSKPSRNKIYGSNAGLCSRQTAGMMLLDDDFDNKVGASSQFYFKIGLGFEEVIKMALRKSGLRYVDELTVRGKLNKGLPEVSGRIDFTVEKDSELVLVELKSCGKLPDKPKLYHLEQLKTYMLMTGVNKGVLWYISRNVADYKGELQMAVFEVEPTRDQLHETAKTIAIGSLGATKKILPQIPEHMKRYKCGFCPLVKMCWEDKKTKMDGTLADDYVQLELESEAQKVADEFMLTRLKLAEDFREYFEENLWEGSIEISDKRNAKDATRKLW